MSWNDIIAQHRVKKIINTSIELNRLPHALLFYGSEGVGKDAVAIHLAKVLNCKSGGTDSCDKCTDCKQINTLQHPNLNLVFAMPVGKGEESSDSPIEKISADNMANIYSQIEQKAKNFYHKIAIDKANTIKISSIRDVRRETAMSVSAKGKRVIIIMNAEDMGIEASNALLKTLEEPSQNTILILTSSNKDALLPTIVSRCQLIRFDELTENQIKEALIIRENVDEEKSNIIARLANGNYRRALEMINTDFFEKRSQLVNFLVLVLTSDTLKISQEVERIVKSSSKPEIEQFFLMLNVWFRDVKTMQEGADNIINTDLLSRLTKFLNRYPNGDFHRIITAIEKSISLIQKNVYIPLVFFRFIVTIRNILLVKSKDF
ncbi:MAG: DNA polymerase III subunit delta' [Bacteroidota bacterium]|nr:DNA polymerase III subunit delta' [Bacteroidota bacterium]